MGVNYTILRGKEAVGEAYGGVEGCHHLLHRTRCKLVDQSTGLVSRSEIVDHIKKHSPKLQRACHREQRRSQMNFGRSWFLRLLAQLFSFPHSLSLPIASRRKSHRSGRAVTAIKGKPAKRNSPEVARLHINSNKPTSDLLSHRP